MDLSQESSLSSVSRKIVIFDDDRSFAEMLHKLLHNLGRLATISTDAVVDAFELSDDDIVFLDVQMPNTSGLQVLDQLAYQVCNCSIILMSGHPELIEAAEKYAKALKLNLVGVLYKPFRLADIQEVMTGFGPAIHQKRMQV